MTPRFKTILSPSVKFRLKRGRRRGVSRRPPHPLTEQTAFASITHGLREYGTARQYNEPAHVLRGATLIVFVPKVLGMRIGGHRTVIRRTI